MIWLFIIVAVVTIVAGPVVIRRTWRGDIAQSDLGAIASVYASENLRRGHARAIVPVMGVGYAILCIGFTLVLFPEPAQEGAAAVKVFFVALMAAIAASVVLYWSIVLFNRPQMLVPPPFRDQPGAVEARRRLRRRR